MASSFAYTDWPPYAPYSQDTYVNGTCQAGFQATNKTNPPQRLCLASGSYQATLLNPCIRTALRLRAGTRAGGDVQLTSSPPRRPSLRTRGGHAEINCTAQASFANASWVQTASGTMQAGICATGFVTTTSPLRYCQIDGTWSSAISNPCLRRSPGRRPAGAGASALMDGPSVKAPTARPPVGPTPRQPSPACPRASRVRRTPRPCTTRRQMARATPATRARARPRRSRAIRTAPGARPPSTRAGVCFAGAGWGADSRVAVFNADSRRGRRAPCHRRGPPQRSPALA